MTKVRSRSGWNRLTRQPIVVALLVLLWLGPYRLAAQIGTWQSHASYQSGQSVAQAGEHIYVATRNGLFYYNKTTGETTIVRKRTDGGEVGLSDVGISRLLYVASLQRLLIAYRNGNLDLMRLTATGEPELVQNINTIVTATSLPAQRTIHHLHRVGNTAYLSTDFGLVVFDLDKAEIRDTYFSRRSDGTPLPFYATTTTTDSLYAIVGATQSTGTDRHLQAIRFSATVNLADPANWRTITEPAAQTESIVAQQNRLLATVNGMGVFERQGNRWLLTQALTNPIVRLFPAANGSLLATNTAITLPGSATFAGPLLADPREVIADGNRVWVADAQRGLLAGNAATFERIAPQGPTQDVFTRLYAYPQTLVALPGSPFTGQYVSAGLPLAEHFSVPVGQWQSVSATSNLPAFNAAAYLPTEQRLFMGSYGAGLWTQTEGQPLSPVTLPATVGPYISSLATDADGNLWLTTAGPNAQRATLHVRRPDGLFQSFPSVNLTTIVQVVPDDNGFLWLLLDGGSGILVFDPATNRSRLLTSERGNGGLLTSTVRALVKDRDGLMWAGTDLGPTVFDNPAGVFDGAVDAQPPRLNGRRLLENEPVTSIAVDGGNRKWLGTRNGLYYVAPDGSQLLETFTTLNSPLPANLIQALAIEPVGGQVFIQTPGGLVSYQGPATDPAPTLSRPTIFPNPVRPDFTGTVGINGLTERATVKILDAGGQLVYETRSQGGTATWNLHDYRGRPAQTGVYLVVVVNADGLEGIAGKLAVVR